MMKIKKEKGTKKCITKRKLKFEDYKNSFEAAQIENKLNHLEKNKIDIDQKEFIKNNKLILKTQQRFWSEEHNVLTEEINKITLSSNDDKRMQSIDSIESYTYWMSKVLVSEKEKVKCSIIIKWYKNN